MGDVPRVVPAVVFGVELPSALSSRPDRIERFDPAAVSRLGAHESRRGIEDVLIIERPFQVVLVILFLVQLFGQDAHAPVVVTVFEGDGHRLPPESYLFDPFRLVGGLGREESLLPVHLVEFGSPPVVRAGAREHGRFFGVAFHRFVGGFDVEIAVSLHVGVGDRRRFVAADHIAEPSAVDQPVALLLHPDVGAHQVVLDFRLNQQA